MKKNLFFSFSAVLMFLVFGFTSQMKAAEELPAYFKVAELQVSMDAAAQSVTKSLSVEGFEILGNYSPGNNADLQVIAFTRKDLQNICLNQKDRGALASVLKVGLQKTNDKVVVSVLNPMYLFYAYLADYADKFNKELTGIDKDVFAALKNVGSLHEPFGGSLESDDLKDYHFMAMMPRFDDPVELNEFSSFDEGVSIIRKNLEAKKGNTVKVYELIFPDKEIAIFGVGLLDAEEGEAYFLPIIGEGHVAAMPYEIIIEGKEATMQHGKYRFALHWPELTMGEFMKIMSTPGDVEEALEELTK